MADRLSILPLIREPTEAGDRITLGIIFRVLNPRLHRYVSWKLGDACGQQEVEDIVHTTLAKFLRQQDGQLLNTDEMDDLHLCALFMVRDEIEDRRPRLHRRRSEPADGMRGTRVGSAWRRPVEWVRLLMRPPVPASCRTIRHSMREILASLPPRIRDPWILVREQELAVREAADVMAVSSQSIRAALCRTNIELSIAARAGRLIARLPDEDRRMRLDDWLVPAGVWRELTAAEIYDAVNEDHRITLITDYLSNALTGDMRAEVERRLEQDDRFRFHVAPVIDAWKAWPSFDDYYPAESEQRASWRRFRVKAGWTQRVIAPRAADDAESIRLQRKIRLWRIVTVALFAVMLSEGAWMAFVAWRRIYGQAVYSAQAEGGSPKRVNIGGKSTVSLSPGSQLIWTAGVGSSGARELRLDGSATFQLIEKAGNDYLIMTPSAYVTVRAAQLETVRAAQLKVEVVSPGITRVSVHVGSAVIWPRGWATQLLTVSTGETAEATWERGAKIVR